MEDPAQSLRYFCTTFLEGQLGDKPSVSDCASTSEKKEKVALSIETESKTSRKRKSEVGSSRLLDNPEDENTSHLANADNVAAVVENQETSNQDLQELCLTAGSSSEVDKPPIAGDLNLNSSVVNLGSCSSVEFEQREGVPGVSYVSADGGHAGWTPVHQCRRGLVDGNLIIIVTWILTQRILLFQGLL